MLGMQLRPMPMRSYAQNGSGEHLSRCAVCTLQRWGTGPKIQTLFHLLSCLPRCRDASVQRTGNLFLLAEEFPFLLAHPDGASFPFVQRHRIISPWPRVSSPTDVAGGSSLFSEQGQVSDQTISTPAVHAGAVKYVSRKLLTRGVILQVFWRFNPSQGHRVSDLGDDVLVLSELAGGEAQLVTP